MPCINLDQAQEHCFCTNLSLQALACSPTCLAGTAGLQFAVAQIITTSAFSYVDNMCLAHSMYVYRWGVHGDVITFAVQSRLPAAEWIGIGLSELGSMKGADMFIIKKSSSHGTSSGPSEAPWQVIDSFATDFESPVPDDHQDLKLLSSSSSQSVNSYTTAVLFQRKLAPCDEKDLPILQGTPVYVIWAFGDSDLEYHGRSKRGQQAAHPRTAGGTSCQLHEAQQEVATNPGRAEDLERISVSSTGHHRLCAGQPGAAGPLGVQRAD